VRGRDDFVDVEFITAEVVTEVTVLLSPRVFEDATLAAPPDILLEVVDVVVVILAELVELELCS
jgi:hypothetical protein